MIKKIETNIKRNLFMDTSLVNFENKSPNNLNKYIKINPSKKFQPFLGFGGAFTESTCYVLKSAPKEVYNKILNEYFVILNYNFGRLTIGSSDFSLKSYSYSYKKDLSDFSINKDLEYIIPVVKDALSINPNIQFVSSPWSPPAFMKSNKNLTLGGKLLDSYKDIWAKYLVKYIKEYAKLGISIDYMTIQNEPDATQFWESCKYSAEDEAKFLINHLYPCFKENEIKTKVLIWDHNKDLILERANDTLVKYGALNYASGIAFHWYTGSYFENLEKVHNLFPNMLLFHTEGCTGYSKFKPKDELFNAEMYATEICGDLNSGTNAFIDWNMVLDFKGGPNHKRNYCNSPIMLSKDNKTYIKTPAFYYIGQFSKFIKPYSRRIEIETNINDIQVTGFENPDNSIVIVLFNKNDYNVEFDLEFNSKTIHDNLDSHAIVTFEIKNELQ